MRHLGTKECPAVRIARLALRAGRTNLTHSRPPKLETQLGSSLGSLSEELG
jgi:hypothetical protein